ncbi:hypothetical protein GTA08_BOTSDO03493 [Neofusicoccum parvum]|nr:hypothetical protein GTA08_BOTSDO03493 [Neofusicoccum parvum]
MKALCALFYLPSLREFVGNKITTNPEYNPDTLFDPESEAEHSDALSLASTPGDNDWDSLPSDPEDPEDSNAPAVSVSRRHLPGPLATLKYPVRTSPITTLTLTSTNLLPQSSRLLLTAPTALQTLTITWADLFDYARFDGTRSHLFNPCAVLSALTPHAATLTSLALHIPYRLFRAATDHGPLEDLPRIGSLKPLTALKHLSISALLLTGSALHRNAPVPPAGDGEGRLAPAGGYGGAADVFPGGLEALVVVANAWAGGDEVLVERPGPEVAGFLSPLVAEHVAPLVVEIARVVGRGGVPALRQWRVVEGGWPEGVREGMVAEVAALLEGSGVVLELGGTATRLGAQKGVWRHQVLWE